jgi:hypothetical protein
MLTQIGGTGGGGETGDPVGEDRALAGGG